MNKQNKKHNKKLKRLLIICLLCAIILTVSTYAWFIGMKTVNVSSFDVDIATTEGLFLSMDGQNWSYQLDARNATPYAKNTNVWADGNTNKNGLIPMSSVGDMDSTSSTMKLYEKASLTATKGGYRLLASRVHNFDNQDTNNNYIEGDGYVAFDLFIKNLSGTEYYATNEPLNEEAIYLTTNSAVTVAQDGEANTGIENSVRVAFTQIARVKADTQDIDKITGVKCAGDSENGVTGICRNAQIWEPNDKAHVAHASSWYNTSCLTRKAAPEGTTISKASAYNTGDGSTCTAVANGTAYPTFAVSRAIGVDDNVDVYDGANYNTFTSDTATYADYRTGVDGKTGAELTTAQNGFKLVNYPYFTDTDKDKTGMERPTFMTLAPNSITKVRVYIYIEGQDIDNYDFASLGKKISINFGFTKERFTETDVTYDSANSPSTNITNVNGTHVQNSNLANNNG